MKHISGGMWIRQLALMFIVAATPQTQGQDTGQLLDEAIQREIARLAPDSLKLPEPSAEPVPPPPLIQEAGNDFVSAWRTWEMVMAPSSSSGQTIPPPERKDLINAATEREQFHALLKRCIEAEIPPDLSEFSRFTYSSLDWCGDGVMTFGSSYEKGITLLQLRHSRYFDALKRLSVHGDPAKHLLRVFGVNSEEFQIGAWLHQKAGIEDLCKTGGELTARMLMDWVDLHWEVAQERYKKAIATKNYLSYDEPAFPRTEFLQLLKPDNGVKDETKARIAKFIKTRGQEMYSLKPWLSRYPKGAEKWLVPLATSGLANDLNDVRKRSSRILTAAGIAHPEPELRPSPRFKVQINGMPWPGKFRSAGRYDPGFSVRLLTEDGTGTGADLSPHGSDLYSADPDKFREYGSPRTAQVIIEPEGDTGKPVNPASLWLRAKVPLPIDFSGVNQIVIKTGDFTISPRFPSRTGTAEDEVYEVEFDMAEGDQVPKEGRSWLVVKGRKPLVLPNVSPGEYWLRIYYPGSVLTPRKKITVSWWKDRVVPMLETGSSLVVPVEWPELQAPEKLPPQLARAFVWFSPDLRDSLKSVIRLKRNDGSVIKEFGRTPEAAGGRFPNSVIFPYLPPGEYMVESPDWTMEPDGTTPGFAIKRSAINVVIREDSPVFVTSAPLKIHYSRKD